METYQIKPGDVVVRQLDNRDSFESNSNQFLDKAKAIEVIKTDEDNKQASELLKATKIFIKETEKSCKPRINQVNELKKSLVDDMKKLIKPAQDAVAIINQLLIDFENEKQRRRIEEQKKAEEERIKREAEVRKQEEERKLSVASELSEAGHEEEANKVLNQPQRIQPEAEISPSAKPKEEAPQGLHFRETWKAQMIAENIEDVDNRFVKKVFDKDLANAYAKSHKNGAKAKGIKFYCEKTPVQRTK